MILLITSRELSRIESIERLNNMTTATKAPNFSAAQEAIILAVAAANGGVLNGALAKEIAARDDMRDNNGNERKDKSIIAKINRMIVSGEPITYAKRQAETKDGRPVVKKTDLVDRIAMLVNVQAAKLDGMSNSPKLALETLVAAIEDIVADDGLTLAANG